MIDHGDYRHRMQSEMEASLRDVLSILQLGASGPEASKSGDLISTSFFNIPSGIRSRAILDPRVVVSLEEIQRLVSKYGAEAMSRPEWEELTGVVLRLEVFCLVHSHESGSVTVRASTDEWVSIPGTSLYARLVPAPRHILVEGGSVIASEVYDGRVPAKDQQHESLPFIALPERPLVPPIADKRLLSLSRDEREEWTLRITAAFDLMSRHEPSYSFVCDYAWLLVPLADNLDGVSSSISFNSLPHAIFTSLHTDLMFAETLVHESDHQWLYSITRFEELWMIPDHLQEPLHRSPWRDDPRPLDGLLRGGSAFVRVGSMWASLSESLPRSHPALEWVRKRAVLCNYQSVDALRTVQQHSDILSPFGRELWSSLTMQAVATRDQVTALHDFATLLSYAEATQQEHDRAFTAKHPSGKSFPLNAKEYINYQMPT